MSRKNDYATGNLIDYLYHQNYYKPCGIDLRRQKNSSGPQKNNFIEKLEEQNDGTMFLIAEKQKNLFKTFL